MDDPNDVRLTDADVQNGWTAETLAEHIAQTLAAEHTALMSRIFPDRRRVVVESCDGFDPHEWKG